VKRVTFAIDDELVREARRIAANRSTSLNALIRGFLAQLTGGDARAVARARIIALCRSSKAEVGPRVPSRDDVHER